MTVVKKAGFVVLLMLALPLSWNALTYLNFDASYGFLKLKQQAIATGLYLPAYYSHVLVAGIILVAGIFQLNEAWRKRWPAVHTRLGKLYVFGVLFFAAPGALVMTLFVDRGAAVFLSFALQTGAWVLTTYLAWAAIRKRDFIGHRHWMWRSFSLTLAAITLRAYVFMASWSLDLAHATAYATIAWLSWVPNLLVCEAVIWLRSRPAPAGKKLP